MSDPGRLHVDQEEAADLVITHGGIYTPMKPVSRLLSTRRPDSERYDQRIKAGQSRPRGFTTEPPPTPSACVPTHSRRPGAPLEAAAQLCDRSPKTLANLISKYQLPRRLGWRARNRKRRRAVLLNPPTVACQRRTLLAPA